MNEVVKIRSVYFYVFIVFYAASFIWDKVLLYLNWTRMSPQAPKEVEGVYAPAEYAKQQEYQKENDRFSMCFNSCSFLLGMMILWFGGLGWLDTLLRKYIDHPVALALAFFGVISVCSLALQIPFDWYETFVIEQKFGFNKTTPWIFITDQVKNFFLGLTLEGLVVGVVVSAYIWAGRWFWAQAWAVLAGLGVLLAFFFSEWIVPLFNQQTPLEEGELRSAIEAFTEKASFPVHNIYMIDGSKRSTKSNAYFTGFGRKKRIVLYDTLIGDLSVEEVVAVLAHEIGHYKMRHIIYGMILSAVNIGLILLTMSLFLGNPEFAQALGGALPSFHLDVCGLSLLLGPFFAALDVAKNHIFRRQEYVADNFTVSHGMGDALILALKKISSKALVNLTPHPLVVFWSYSHPTLLQRIARIKGTEKS
ncbi:MAG: M48 family metallopeptidase [Synergistaceae bacterium]|jgi:STE24 endopeptidase|nr:M48 family metallopeptidase [Synergistaceae bacterium]